MKCQQTRSLQLAVRVLYGFFAFIVITLAVLASLGELMLFWSSNYSSSVPTPFWRTSGTRWKDQGMGKGLGFKVRGYNGVRD